LSDSLSPTRSRPGGTLTTEAIVGDGGGFHTSQGDSSALANARRAMNEGVDTVLEMSDDGESRPTPILVCRERGSRVVAAGDVFRLDGDPLKGHVLQEDRSTVELQPPALCGRRGLTACSLGAVLGAGQPTRGA